jgi:7,8-dihydroneopterin aldolase/epimerase/oxygenase
VAADSITLENMAFFGFHGTKPSEGELGGRFFVDVVMHADLSKPGRTDRLADTIDYERAFAIVRDHVEGKRFKLLEALAQNIADALLEAFKPLAQVEVRVRKPGVPIRGILDYTEIEVVRDRAAPRK